MNRRVQACCWRKSGNCGVQGKWEKVPNTLSTGRRVENPDANGVRHLRLRRREQAPARRHQDPERFRPAPRSLLRTRHPLPLPPERRCQRQLIEIMITWLPHCLKWKQAQNRKLCLTFTGFIKLLAQIYGNNKYSPYICA